MIHPVSDSRGRGAHCLGNMELWRQRRRVWLWFVGSFDVSFRGMYEMFEKCERCGLCEWCETYELCQEHERYELWEKFERYS